MPSGMKWSTKRHECRQTTNDMFAADLPRTLCCHQWQCAPATGTFLSPHSVLISTCVTWPEQKIIQPSIWLAAHDGQMSESQSWRTKAPRVTTFPQQLVKHAGGKKQTENLHSHQTGRQLLDAQSGMQRCAARGWGCCGNHEGCMFLPSVGSKSETPLSLRHAD